MEKMQLRRRECWKRLGRTGDVCTVRCLTATSAIHSLHLPQASDIYFWTTEIVPPIANCLRWTLPHVEHEHDQPRGETGEYIKHNESTRQLPSESICSLAYGSIHHYAYPNIHKSMIDLTPLLLLVHHATRAIVPCGCQCTARVPRCSLRSL